MRIAFFSLLVLLSALIGLAQTPNISGPMGKIEKSPRPPDTHPEIDHSPPMVLIQEGEYEMGDHLGTGWFDELPIHAVFIDAFYMDTFEVTNDEYCACLNSAYGKGLIEVSGGVVYKKNAPEPFCDTTTSSSDSRITWNGNTFGVIAGTEAHPMVMVSWYGAVAYANWRSMQEGKAPCYDLSTWRCNFGVGGYRLPTEAEWEKAARGGEYDPYYDYPWGNSVDGSMANYLNSGDPYEAGAYPWTSPVGYYNGSQIPSGKDMANGYGLYDMAGNVWEWCNDWYDDAYYGYCLAHGIYLNPKGPANSAYDIRVLRGGSWFVEAFYLRCAFRGSYYFGDPSFRFYDVGFRLVLD